MRLVVCCLLFLCAAGEEYPTPTCNGSRVPPAQRRFNSTAINGVIAAFQRKLRSPNISKLFENCLPNCLDTTVVEASEQDSFVITGDIPAMWLRDSTNQLLPYVPYISEEPKLQQLVCGAIHRQARQVTTNRYANAFNQAPSSAGHKDDTVTTSPEPTYCENGAVYENKYELDSLVNVLQLSNEYFKWTNDLACFSSQQESWLGSVQAIIETIVTQQSSTSEDFTKPSYTFQRLTTVSTDTLMNQGRGVPAKRNGMSKSYFRASDDATVLPFNIPANAFAVVHLRRMANGLLKHFNSSLAATAAELANQIDAGIQADGVVAPRNGKPYYVYEVDGFGSAYFMDDANIPSLLSLPYLGYVEKDDPVYLETRRKLLSTDTNPWYFQGRAGKGIGGPHQGTNMIWPMSIIMKALTSTDDAEISECLHLLETTHADMFYMHESFNKDNQFQFTRSWFSWANSLFGELILTLARERPHLIFK